MEGLVSDPFTDADTESKEQEKKEQREAKQGSTDKRYCTYCGGELSTGVDEKLFCPKCGYKPSEETNQQQPQFTVVQQDQHKKKKDYLEWIKIALYIIGAIIIIFMTMMLLRTADSAMSIF